MPLLQKLPRNYVRDISIPAGTNEAMIHYYFGSKEGLLVSILQDVMRLFPHNCED
jgi:AcrR family transcriptional regulator